MTEDKQVQMKREEYVGSDVVLEDVIPKTATDAVQDPTTGNDLAETLDAIWAAINNKLSRIVNSVNGRTGVVILTAADVGLENVDNVSTDDLKSWVINLVAEQFHNKHLILANKMAEIDNIRDTGDTKYDGVSFVASHYADDPDDHTMVIGYFYTDNNNNLTYDYRTFDLDDEYGVGKFYYAADHTTILGEYFNDYENNIAAGTFSHVEGSRNRTTGAYSHLEGCQNINSGASVHMGGTGNSNSGSNVYMSGEGNVNASDYTFIHGRDNIVSEYGDVSFVVGNGNHLSIPKSFLFGDDNRIEVGDTKSLNFIIGKNNHIGGNMSNIFGSWNNVNCDYTNIIGGHNKMVGSGETTVIGDGNEVGSALDSFVYGIANSVDYAANNTVLFGFRCTSSLAFARTFGYQTNTMGENAVNFGHGVEMNWEYEYALLTEEPSDWDDEYTKYFTKVGMEYVKIPKGEETPSFALDTYYKAINVQVETRDGSKFNKVNPFPNNTRFEEFIPLHEAEDSHAWSIAYGAGSILFGQGNIAGGVNDFVEGSRNITYGNTQNFSYQHTESNSNHVEGDHNELRWRVRDYNELTAMPSNWANKFNTYYEKNINDEYVHVSGTVAPAWEAGKYYDSERVYPCATTHVEGSTNIVTDIEMCHVEGQDNIVSHIKNSHIEGTENNPYVDRSLILPDKGASAITAVHIEGHGNLINEHELDATVQSYSHTEGMYNVYAGTASHVQNIKNSADEYGTAMGAYNRATPFATVVGFSNKVIEPTVKPVTIVWWAGDMMGLPDKKYRSNRFMVVTDSLDQSYEFISPFDGSHATISITYLSSSSDIETVSGLDGGQIFKPVTNSPNRWRVQRSALEGLTNSPIDSTTDLNDPTIALFIEITYNESIGDHLFEVGNGGFAAEDFRTDFNANAFAVGVEGNAYVQNDVRLHYEHITSTQTGVIDQGGGQMISGESSTREVVPVSLQKLIKKLLDDGVISIEDITTDEFK